MTWTPSSSKRPPRGGKKHRQLYNMPAWERDGFVSEKAYEEFARDKRLSASKRTNALGQCAPFDLRSV